MLLRVYSQNEDCERVWGDRCRLFIRHILLLLYWIPRSGQLNDWCQLAVAIDLHGRTPLHTPRTDNRLTRSARMPLGVIIIYHRCHALYNLNFLTYLLTVPLAQGLSATHVATSSGCSFHTTCCTPSVSRAAAVLNRAGSSGTCNNNERRTIIII